MIGRKRKIGRNDTRIGNFVFHLENGAVKVSDLNGIVSHRISTLIPKGKFLEMALKEKKEEWLHGYCAVMFNALSCVPDAEFFDALNKAAVDCVNRHKDLYGIKDNIGKDEDDAILSEQKELNEAMEELKDESKN